MMTRSWIWAGATLMLVAGFVLWSLLGRQEEQKGGGFVIVQPSPPVLAPASPVGSPSGIAPQQKQVALVDSWVGRWEGLDGQFMLIEKEASASPGHYLVTMRHDLNEAERTYPAEAAATSLIVKRDGISHQFTLADGKTARDTRLAGRHDCLSTPSGEIYCRG
jgi:hypothetical protein